VSGEDIRSSWHRYPLVWRSVCEW